MTGDLGGISLFGDLPPSDRDTITKRCRWRKYGDGQHVIAHHDATSDIS